MLKKWTVCIALLAVVTVVVAVVHLNNQEKIECMKILQEEREIAVSFVDLERGSFSGALIDGKGDVTIHEYTGILLRELLEEKGIDPAGIGGVTVTSADNYRVEFTQEEILQADKVYVAVTADGVAIPGIDPESDGVQIIVFGDDNSRRCVRFAQQITVE